MAPFQYDRLDLSRDAIRLVRLFKGKPPEPICCELWQTYLDEVDGVPYEALSYTWGDDDPSPQTRILLNGQEVYVRKNLHTALGFLRLEEDHRLLWIDAICIDQAYDEEKTHQVNQMRLIYKYAECVLFWLGPSGPHTDALMALASDIDRDIVAKLPRNMWRLSMEQTLEFKAVRAEWSVEAARDLVARPWFTRVWILQEVASARRGTIICGEKSAPARTWALLVPLLLGTDMDDHTRAVLSIMPGPQRSGWWQETRDLFTLLRKFGHSKASDPRDKVYALIGISSDAGQNRRLVPDYSADTRGFVHNTISYLLLGAVHDQLIAELPSWSIDEFFQSLDDLPRILFRWAMFNGKSHALAMLLSPGTEHGTHFGKNTLQAWRDAEIDVKDEIGQTPLSQAADIGYEELVRLLLKVDGVDADSADSVGRTPLWYAAKRGHKEILRLLLETGSVHADPKDLYGRTPLSCAAERGHEEIVGMLLQRESVDADSRDCDGRAPLWYAAQRGHEGVVALLLETGRVDFDPKDYENQTPREFVAIRMRTLEEYPRE